MKTRAYFGVLIALALFASACGGDDDGGEFALVSEGKLTVCTDVPYPPMEFEDASAPGGYTGFDIELMRAIATDLDLELAVATPGWDAITSGLANEAGDCDISAASITITDEREENIDFTEPYFNGQQSLLVEEGSTGSSLADMTSVAVQTGTTGEIWLADNAPASVEVISFGDIGDLYLALSAGEVDGVVTDLVGNQGFVDENGGTMILESYDTDEFYGFAVQEEGKEALLEAVNASLAKLREDGTYDTVYGEWFSA